MTFAILHKMNTYSVSCFYFLRECMIKSDLAKYLCQVTLTWGKMKDSLLCQTSVKGWIFSWMQLFFSSYKHCLRFCPPFLPSPPAFLGYVIDARDLQLSNFVMWLFHIPFFSKTAAKWLESDWKVTGNTEISEILSTTFYRRFFRNSCFVGFLSRSSCCWKLCFFL